MCCRYDFNDKVSGKVQLQLVQDEGQSHVMGDLDFKVHGAVCHVYTQQFLFASSECMDVGQRLEQPAETRQWRLLWYVANVMLHVCLCFL